MKSYELSNGMVVSERVVGQLEKGAYITYEHLANMIENMVLSNGIFNNAEIDCIEFYDDDRAEELLQDQLEQYGDEYYNEGYDIYEYTVDTINESCQFYIVDTESAKTLVKFDETVLYHTTLDLSIWCVSHWGTIWRYANTDIVVDNVLS